MNNESKNEFIENQSNEQLINILEEPHNWSTEIVELSKVEIENRGGLKKVMDAKDYIKIIKPISEPVVIFIDRTPTPAYITIVSSLFILVGCFMPWIQLGPLFVIRGIDNPNGAIMIVTGIVTCAVAILNLSKKENKNYWIFIVAGIIGLIVFYLDFKEIRSRTAKLKDGLGEFSNLLDSTDKISTIDFIGSGLYIVLLGSIGLILSGVGLFKKT